jgi:hypothetical protein
VFYSEQLGEVNAGKAEGRGQKAEVIRAGPKNSVESQKVKVNVEGDCRGEDDPDCCQFNIHNQACPN